MLSGDVVPRDDEQWRFANSDEYLWGYLENCLPKQEVSSCGKHR